MPIRPLRRALTRREQTVLQLLAQGHSNREIAERLGIKPGTVESHVHHILKKLGVTTRLQAALWLAREGLLSDKGVN